MSFFASCPSRSTTRSCSTVSFVGPSDERKLGMAGSKGLRCEAPAWWCPTEGPLVPGRCAWAEEEYAAEEDAEPEEAAPRGGRPPGEPTVEGRAAGWSYGTYVAREEEEEERPRGSSLADVLVGGKDRPTFSNLHGGSGWA